MTCKKRKKQYVSSYIPMRHTRIYCIRVCAYMHTRMCVYAYAYWADAHYAYILVRTYLSCTVSEENIVVVKDNLYDCPREIDTDVIIAQKLIAPLLGPEGIIVLNSHHAASSELHGLKEPSKLRVASPTGIWRGLGIGHPSAWHGEVDMMVVANDEILSGATAVLALPVAQPAGDEGMLNAGCIMAEGKKNSSDLGLGFSQAIATAITFSFVQKAQYSCKGTLFPTIQVSRNGFEIFLYDSDTDVLLMNSFTWAPTNIGFLWAVLHYGL